MEETLWEVGASRCLQVAGAGSNGLIFSQIDLLAKPPLHPILNKTSQRKEDWHDEIWCLGDWTIHLFIWIIRLFDSETEEDGDGKRK